jgi:hypothetical protein
LLLAQELLGADVPGVAAEVLPVTRRVRAVADSIRAEILARGYTEDDPHGTLLGLEERRWARVWYRGRVWHRVNVRVNARDRAAVQLPRGLGFLYGLVRAFRLAVKYGGQAFPARLRRVKLL